MRLSVAVLFAVMVLVSVYEQSAATTTGTAGTATTTITTASNPTSYMSTSGADSRLVFDLSVVSVLAVAAVGFLFH